MKKTNLLYLFAIAIPSLGFSFSNDSFISLTGFELEMNEVTNKVKLLTRYSSSIAGTSKDCYFDWMVKKDGGVESYVYHAMMSNFKIVSNIYLDVTPEVDISTLGTDNVFIVKLTPSDMGGGSIRKEIRFNIKGKSQVTFKESDNNVGVSSGYIIENYSPYDESKNYILEDRVIFQNYEDLVVEDYYLNFDIKRFLFNYTGNKNKSVLEGDFYLLIYDKYNLFNDLPLFKESQYRYIPLKVSVLDGDSLFSFKDNIYYDTLTHNTSLSYKEGYKETDKLYFPIGKLSTLKTIHCMLYLDIEGYTNFNMSSEFDIYFMKNYFGDCSDSEYCIETNNDDGTNVREKVVEVNL